jgi:hypothetical protein
MQIVGKGVEVSRGYLGMLFHIPLALKEGARVPSLGRSPAHIMLEGV